jgi:hypothetical protein
MARLVRATQPKVCPQLMKNELGMGHPDKPGDDEIY